MLIRTQVKLPQIKFLECIKKNHLRKIKALIVMHHGGYPQYLKDFYDIKKGIIFILLKMRVMH